MHIERHSLSGPSCVDTASTKDEDTCTLVVRRTVRLPTSDEMTTHYCRARTRADAAPSAHISLPAKSLTNGARGKWVRNVRTSTQAERARKGYGPLHIPLRCYANSRQHLTFDPLVCLLEAIPQSNGWLPSKILKYFRVVAVAPVHTFGRVELITPL